MHSRVSRCVQRVIKRAGASLSTALSDRTPIRSRIAAPRSSFHLRSLPRTGSIVVLRGRSVHALAAVTPEPRAPRSLPVLPTSDAYPSLRASRPGLPRRALRGARCLAEALFARDDGPAPSERLDWLEQDLSDFFAHVTLRARLLFRACVATLVWIAPLLIARLPPLSRLSASERVEALHRAERTPLSLALLAAKAILCIVYYEHPDAAREIGWDSRCRGPAP